MNYATQSPQAAPSNSFANLLKYAALGLLIYAGVQFMRRPAAVPTPDTKVAAAFAQTDDRSGAAKHAKLFATICQSISETLDYDGKQKTPLITNGVQLDMIRLRIRDYRTAGKSFAAIYPQLPAAVEEVLNARIGTKSQAIDVEYRAKCVLAFRDLASMAAAFK